MSYVDDILKSVPTIKHAENLIQQIEKVLDSGGYKVKHWKISASKNNTSKSNSLNIIGTNEVSVPGMLWKSQDDIFAFKVNTNYQPNSM